MTRIISHGLIIYAALLGVVAATNAQSPYQVRKSAISDVEFYTTNYGIFGLDVAGSKAGFFVPRGSGLSYVFQSGMWFGAMKKVGSDTNHLSFITCNPNSGASWASPVGAADSSKAEPLYYSGNYDRLTGQPTASEAGTAAWPLWLRFNDTPHPGGPGIFESDRSARHSGATYSRPAFVPGAVEQFVSHYNDADLGRYERITHDSAVKLGLPLGLDFQQNVYAWGEGPFKDVVIIEYAITNTTRDTLFNCVMGQITDADLGNASNDHCSFLTSRPDLRAACTWTEPEGKSYQVLVTAIIEAPVTDESGYIDAGDRKRYRLEGRAGAFRGWSIEDDPYGTGGRYDFMADRTHFDIDNGPGDSRMLLASTPFNMRPFEVVHFTVAYGVASPRMADIYASRSSRLDTLVDAINDAYYNRESFAGVHPEPAVVPAGAAMLLPNPARDGAMIRFTVGDAGGAMLRVANSIGRQVIERDLGRLDCGMHEAMIDVHDLPSGPYLVSIITGTQVIAAKLTVVR
jgi:hypothetical protein